MKTPLNPTMITLAREFRGFSQQQLAEKVGITQGFLSRVEKGFVEPTEEILNKLSNGLNVKQKFFYRKGDTFTPNLYYRKKSRTSRGVLIRAEAEMNFHRLNIQELLDSVEITTPPLPCLDISEEGGPENAARKLRQLWKVPNGPIKNLFQLLEGKGIIIVPCLFESPDIDGRSMYTDDGQALIFINRLLPMDRQRFTVCHETVHVVCHMHSSVSDSNDTEREANRFAAEFLVPEKELRKQIVTKLNLSVLADLKRYWRVSMAAILYHAKLSRIILDRRYKSLIIEMGKLGMRTKEPSELNPPLEKPKVLTTLFRLHKKDLGYSDEEIAELLSMDKEEMINIYYEDDLLDYEGNKKLKLVI
ncbi:MAG: ImmA/IrrE family metallo-endopeptidase [Allomuricauda sp.]